MSRYRVLIRSMSWALAIAAGITALWAIWEAFVEKNIGFVNVFAGSAAVITGVISAFAALRSTELTEERLRPYPYPYIDSTSRYSLSQLRIRNVGGTAAHDIYLEWTGNSIPKRTVGNDSDIPLLANGKDNAIAVLLPYESVSQLLGTANDVSKQAKAEGSEWKGYVNFKDSRGQKHRIPFLLDITHLRFGLLYDAEEPKTMHELQQLPDRIRELTKAVESLKPNHQNNDNNIKDR
ncbi:MAG: hypothetical protein WBJ85_07065 [Acetomicrobium sp.]